ncbi:MAG: methyltransferase domain-containing protein [Chitinispirillia bacterium]|nr:methyltransferase domain-containing protein [Chitinispirillia bacterium]MCL2241419.1 methyltransferase domain-containing protein [Chitinispirillia bacterium]
MSWKKKVTWEKKDVVKYYVDSAWAFERFWGPDMHYGYWEKGVRHQRCASRRMNMKLVERINITKDDYVLDAGCGIGGNAVWLAKKYGCKVVGVTIVPEQINTATRRAKEAGVGHLCEFLLMDYMNLQFPDGTFTVVMGLESICYSNPKSDFIKGVYRVLKPGGRFGMADGFAAKEAYVGNEKRLMGRWMDGWKLNNLETMARWKANAESAGFKQADYIDITKNVLPTSKIMLAWSLFSIHWHILDKIFEIRDYPNDALWYQYWAIKKKLAVYGIFWAVK